MSDKSQNSGKPYNKLTVGIAPDSRGVWFPEDDRQINWQTFLDEVTEAGYEVIETGPFGFLPIDPEVLQAECTKRGIRVVADTQFGILHRPKVWEQTEREMRANASMSKVIDVHHLVYLPLMLRDLQTGGWTEDLNLGDADWKLPAGNANRLGKFLKKDHDVTMVVRPRGDSHIKNHEQIDRLFVEADPEYISFCLDTGHLGCGEVGVVDLACSYPDRIGLVYIKQMGPKVVQRMRRENLSFGETVSLGVCVTPDVGQPKVGAVIDALATLNKELHVIVEQGLYPCTPDVPLPLAIETRRILADNHLGIHRAQERIMTKQLGVAVIGADMAGCSHANGYRQANTIHGGDLPPVRPITIADINQKLVIEMAGHYGFGKAVDSRQEIADDPETDVVSVVVGDSLHCEVVEVLLATGKHVLYKKPLVDTLTNAGATVAVAEKAGTVVATAYSFRRDPTVKTIRDLLASGKLGGLIPIEAHYLVDYVCDPIGPMSWWLRGDPGSGVLTDLGAHVVNLAEYVVGPIVSVAGANFTIPIKERNLSLGNVIGHDHAKLSDEKEAVTNDDSAVLIATFANGAATTFHTSRVIYEPPDDLALAITDTQSQAMFSQCHPAEFMVSDNQPNAHTRGDRVVYVGPSTAAVFDDAVPMPGGNISFGYGDLFIYQIRTLLNQVLGRESRLPTCTTPTGGLHAVKVLNAITRCYHSGRTRAAV